VRCAPIARADLDCLVVELVLLIADIFDARACDILNTVHVIVQLVLVRQADLSANHNTVGCGKSFSGDTRLWLFRQERVEDRIADPVTDLIGMPLGNGLGRKNIRCAGHERAPMKSKHHVRKPLWCGRYRLSAQTLRVNRYSDCARRITVVRNTAEPSRAIRNSVIGRSPVRL